ncbi:MAG: hypothetical protein IT429_06490 [Gemmataceae bacterium]|nr:hypothetical protein [Gemmataceae bacterium]
MSMVCPQCRSAFAQALSCPSCSVRLTYQSVTSSGLPEPTDLESRWQNTHWGRLAVGVLVSQGLAHGLQLACTAGLLALGDTSGPAVWSGLVGLIVLQGLQAFGLLIGGALAGAGQSRGFAIGFLVGAISGAAFVVTHPSGGEVVIDVASCGLAMVFGAIGGWLGSVIWKPLPLLKIPGTDSGSRPRPLLRPTASVLAGPVSWLRVGVGIGVAACGIFWPAVLLSLMLDASLGKLRLQSQLQAHLITWEVAGLLILTGGAVAGATTRNPFKHGLFTGIGAAILLAGNMLGNPSSQLHYAPFLAAGVILLTIIGAWFGGQLLPPVVRTRRLSSL